jgi:hypothetical protein
MCADCLINIARRCCSTPARPRARSPSHVGARDSAAVAKSLTGAAAHHARTSSTTGDQRRTSSSVTDCASQSGGQAQTVVGRSHRTGGPWPGSDGSGRDGCGGRRTRLPGCVPSTPAECSTERHGGGASTHHNPGGDSARQAVATPPPPLQALITLASPVFGVLTAGSSTAETTAVTVVTVMSAATPTCKAAVERWFRAAATKSRRLVRLSGVELLSWARTHTVCEPRSP